MILFCPWQDEEKDFFRNDKDRCIEIYEARKEEINSIRALIYPGEATFDLMDSSDFELQKPSHIYDALDGQREQENDDDNDIGIVDDLQYESFAYTGNLNKEADANQEDFKFKKIMLPSNDELRHITCSLVSEQMNILRPVIGFCKDVIKSDCKADGKFKPTPVRIIVHGGAGVGKSKTIQAIMIHSERVLRKSGQKPKTGRNMEILPE